MVHLLGMGFTMQLIVGLCMAMLGVARDNPIFIRLGIFLIVSFFVTLSIILAMEAKGMLPW